MSGDLGEIEIPPLVAGLPLRLWLRVWLVASFALLPSVVASGGVVGASSERLFSGFSSIVSTWWLRRCLRCVEHFLRRRATPGSSSVGAGV